MCFSIGILWFLEDDCYFWDIRVIFRVMGVNNININMKKEFL